MVRMGARMSGRVPIGGAVAAADVPTPHAQPEMDPPAARAEAVLTALARRRDRLDRVQVRALLSHRRPFLEVARSPSGPTVQRPQRAAARTITLLGAAADVVGAPMVLVTCGLALAVAAGAALISPALTAPEPVPSS